MRVVVVRCRQTKGRTADCRLPRIRRDQLTRLLVFEYCISVLYSQSVLDYEYVLLGHYERL